MKEYRIKEVISIILIVVLSINLFGIAAFAAVGDSWLLYTCVRQEKSNWCWAASAENSIRWESQNIRTQKDAVRHIKGTLFDWYPNVGGDISDITTAANYISKGTEIYTGVEDYSSYEFLKEELKRGNVTIASAGYYDDSNTRTGGHATVIKGCDTGDPSNPKILYYDPWNNGEYVCTYQEFCDGSFNERRYDRTCFNAEFE